MTMLRLSNKTDYALLALPHLASEGASGLASTRAIAERSPIPAALLAKILQQLARHGLVAAHKGVRRAPHLVRPAEAISIADVVHAIDGPMTVTACSPRDERCDQFTTCTVRDPLWRVKERILSTLQAVTLAQMDDGANRLAPLAIHKSETAADVREQAR
jgi:Rrf2 family protein